MKSKTKEKIRVSFTAFPFFLNFALKMEVANSSQTSVPTYRATPCYIPEAIIFLLLVTWNILGNAGSFVESLIR